MDIFELVQAINRGDYDEDFDSIYEALKNRGAVKRSQQNVMLRKMLRPGDVCTLTNIRPKLLNGAQVRIENMNTGTKYVDCVMITPRRNRPAGCKIGIQLSCLIPSPQVLKRYEESQEA